MNKTQKKKIIVIVGTTASGKTTLAVDLAYKLGGEVVSADSRQVYKYMDIGTGKDICEYKLSKKVAGKNQKIKIPHHLIDVVSPNTEFNLGKFMRHAYKAIDDIHARGKVPIIAGGTGLYSQAIVDGFTLSDSKKDKVFRDKLEALSLKALQARLKKLDEKAYSVLNNSDKNNRRRLIRYIEKQKFKKSPAFRSFMRREDKKSEPKYNVLLLGVTWPREVLVNRINKRLKKRLEREGMVDEVKDLHFNRKVSWVRLKSFGLEYKFISEYLQKQITYEEMGELLAISIRQFAKKQMSWLKRWEKQGAKINWVKTKIQANKLVKDFLK